jgi:hypothetical protein
VYVWLVVRFPVVSEPLLALVPDQPPDAVQALALLLVQLSVELPPLAMLLGFALSVTVGAAALTVTAAVADPVPPGPEQVNVNVELAVSVPVDCEPCTALVPDQAPDAVQLVALLVDQLRVAAPPLVMVLGAALKLTVGKADRIETVAD